MSDSLAEILLVAGILLAGALFTHWFGAAMYNRCGRCGTLNARRRSVCRQCGALLPPAAKER